MKVVILHQHFNTPQVGGGQRSYYLAQALIKKGIETVVITAHDGPLQIAIIDGIEVHYLHVPYASRYGFFLRSKAYLQFTWKAIHHCRTIRNVSLCYAISVPLTTGYAAMRIKSKMKIPYWFEVGDLWPDAAVEMGFIRTRLFRELLHILERAIYRRATGLIALSPPIREVMERRAKRGVHLLTNFSHTNFFKPVRPANERKLTIAYVGTVGQANGLEHYLACARATQDAGLTIEFLICGKGAYLNKMLALAQSLGLKNVSFIPFQNQEGVRRVLEKSDAVFVCYQHVKILETGSPHKFFDGLAAGKLMILNFNGWLREEAETHGCGFSYDTTRPQEFVEKIKTYLSDREKLHAAQTAARNLAEQKYAADKLSEQFAQLLTAHSTRLP